MGARKRAEYVNSRWDAGDDNMLRLFFGRKLYFLQQIDIEYMKIADLDIYNDVENTILLLRKSCAMGRLRRTEAGTAYTTALVAAVLLLHGYRFRWTTSSPWTTEFSVSFVRSLT